jgi:hypothetical protein
MHARLAKAKWDKLLVLFLLLILTACGGGDEEQQTTEPLPGTGDAALPLPGEQARLRCSASCSSHGYCGPTLNQGPYVLLDRDGPVAAAGQHDMALPAETLVTVEEVQPRTLVRVSGEELQHNFLRVWVPERNETAWISNWCIVPAQ